MSIILRYILRSMWERKLRTILVILAVMVPSAMFFASISISGAMVRMQMDRWRQNYGYSDIIIHAEANSPSPYFYTGAAEKYSANMEYIVGEISGFGVLDLGESVTVPTSRRSDGDMPGSDSGMSDSGNIGVSLRGIELDDLQKLTPVSFHSQEGLYPFKGMKIIITVTAAEKYGIAAGESIVITVNGIRRKFLVCGIVQPIGAFISEGDAICAVIPKDVLCSLYNARGRVDMLYIKSSNPSIRYKLLLKLSQEYGRYVVREPFTEEDIKRETDRATAPIIVVTAILSFMSIYIIYSTFRIIVMERLAVIGTFRSVGAEVLTADAMLLLESLVYGIIGGVAGFVSGIFVLRVMSGIMNPGMADSIYSLSDFSVLQPAGTVMVAVVLCLVGSAGPVIKAVRVPIKELVLDTTQLIFEKNHNILIPFVMLAAALSIPFFTGGSIAKWIDTACIVSLITALILLIPHVSPMFGKAFTWICRITAANIGMIAAKNLRKNNSAINNISLLLIGISGIYMVTTVNYGETRQIQDCFERSDYDIIMEAGQINRYMLNLILEEDGVEDICASYYKSATEVDGQDDYIWHIEGIDTENYDKFFNLNISDGRGEKYPSSFIMNMLDSGRYILLTKTLMRRFNVSAGELITLKIRLASGKKIERRYEILGFHENILPGRWSHALMSERYFRLDIGRGYGPVYIKAAGETDDVVNGLREAFGRQKPSITTATGLKEEAMLANRQLFDILEGFSFITLIVGIVGVFNNLIIGFMQRKRQLAVMRSVGMSRFQTVKMFFIESLTGGILGGATGALAGFSAVLVIIPRLVRTLELETHIYNSNVILLSCALSGIVISIAASAGPAFRLMKLNLIDALKYE